MKKSSTLLESACISVPEFNDLYRRLKRSVELAGKSQSTLTNYARCLAHISLHFKCSPLDLDEEQILDYLHVLKSQHKTPSDSFFKHTIYGLRYAYRIYGMKEMRVMLPSIERPKKLPVVLSRSEVKQLLKTPKLLKHRLVLAMLYGCGLRCFELCNLQLKDLDFDRKMLLIRQGKDRKDRYVPLTEMQIRGLKTYFWQKIPPPGALPAIIKKVKQFGYLPREFDGSFRKPANTAGSKRDHHS